MPVPIIGKERGSTENDVTNDNTQPMKQQPYIMNVMSGVGFKYKGELAVNR
jgi:hypothetical protein